jgi:hypothetical protein
LDFKIPFYFFPKSKLWNHQVLLHTTSCESLSLIIYTFCDWLFCSVGQGEDGMGGAGLGGAGFEFGVDPNEDPELALVSNILL